MPTNVLVRVGISEYSISVGRNVGAELDVTKIGFLDNFMIFMLGIGGVKRATGRATHRRQEEDRKNDAWLNGRRQEELHKQQEADRKMT